MRFLMTVGMVIVSLGISASGQEAEIREDFYEWVDVTGKHRVNAKFLWLKEDGVTLEKMDGSAVTVPLEKLSPEAVALAQILARQAEKAYEEDDAIYGAEREALEKYREKWKKAMEEKVGQTTMWPVVAPYYRFVLWTTDESAVLAWVTVVASILPDEFKADWVFPAVHGFFSLILLGCFFSFLVIAFRAGMGWGIFFLTIFGGSLFLTIFRLHSSNEVLLGAWLILSGIGGCVHIIVGLVFLILHWADTWRVFLTWIFSVIVIMASYLLVPLWAFPEVIEAMAEK